MLKQSVMVVAFSISLIACGGSGTSDSADTDGTSGTTGADGSDGTDGTDGTDGANGTDGADGTDGAAGTACPGAGTSFKQGEKFADINLKNCAGEKIKLSEQICKSKLTLIYFAAG